MSETKKRPVLTLSGPRVSAVQRALDALEAGDLDALSRATRALTDAEVRELHRAQLRAAEAWCRATWPKVFSHSVPLAIGIDSQIMAQRPPHVTRKAVRAFLRQWTSPRSYQDALTAPGSMRHGLDGTPVGPVSEHDKQSATRDVLVAQLD